MFVSVGRKRTGYLRKGRSLVSSLSQLMLEPVPASNHFVMSLTTEPGSTGNACIFDSVKEQLKKNKSVLGRHVLILSDTDKKSSELTQRLWVELQYLGVQSMSASVMGKYPTPSTLQDMTTLARRSSVNSIIAVGDTTVINTATALRQSVALGTYPGSNSRLWVPSVGMGSFSPPLILIPTAVCPSSYYDHSLVLDTNTSDVLSWLKISPSELVIHDQDYLKDFSTVALRSTAVYLLGELMDSLFAALYASDLYTQAEERTLSGRSKASGATDHAAHNWFASMHRFLESKLKALRLNEIFLLHSSDLKAHYKALSEFSQNIAALRSGTSEFFSPLQDPLNWATPVQMRTAYDCLLGANGPLLPHDRDVTVGNFLRILDFIVYERARLINGASRGMQQMPYEVLLHCLSFIIPLVFKERRPFYEAVHTAQAQSKRRSLIENNELFEDISVLLSAIDPDGAMRFNYHSASSAPRARGYDEMRLSEEIHIEDLVYTNDQITSSVVKNNYLPRHPQDILSVSTRSEDGAAFMRLHYIKTDFSIDFCNADFK